MPFDARSVCASVTFLDSRGRPDPQSTSLHHARLARWGVDGILLLGTTGEYPSFSVEERVGFLNEIAPLCPIPLLVGCGALSLADVLTLVEAASRSRAQAVLVPPPFYFLNPTEAGLSRFFRTVLNASSLPVILYHIPAMTRIPLTPSLLHTLVDHPRLLGLKDSTGDPASTTALARAFPQLRVWVGSDRLLSKARELGAFGTMSAGPNGHPRAAALASRGDPSAQEEMNALLDALDAAHPPSKVAAWKWLAHRGSQVGSPEMRLPLLSLPEEVASRLEQGGLPPSPS